MAQKLEFLTSDLAMIVQPAESELELYFLGFIVSGIV